MSNISINHAPEITDFNSLQFQSDHPSGALLATGDGAVTFIDENIETKLYRGLASRNGGEIADLPQ